MAQFSGNPKLKTNLPKQLSLQNFKNGSENNRKWNCNEKRKNQKIKVYETEIILSKKTGKMNELI